MSTLSGERLRELLQEFCIDTPVLKNQRPKTKKKKKEFFNRFVREFKGDFCTPNIMQYLTKLRTEGCHIDPEKRKPWKPGAYNTEVQLIHAFIKWLYLFDHIEKDFAGQISYMQTDTRLKDMIDPDIAEKIALSSNEILDTDNSLEIKRKQERKLYLLMLMYTGARKEELKHVKGDDLCLDVPEPYFKVIRKGNREERMIIPPWFVNTLRERRGWEQVFPANPDGVAKSWKEALKAHGITKHIPIHRFRHIKTTAMIDAGARPEDVKEIMGHKDVDVTLNIYRQFSSKRKSDIQRLYDPLWLKRESSRARLDIEEERFDSTGIAEDDRFVVKKTRESGRLLIEIIDKSLI